MAHDKVYGFCENKCKVEIVPAIHMIGMIFDYAGEEAPPGFLICNGQAVSRTTYKDLYDVIGTKYGAGDNSTTFNIPDLRQRFTRGAQASENLGAKGGEATHILTVEEMPSHTHEQNAHSHSATATVTSGGAHTHKLSINSGGSHTHTWSGTTSSNGNHKHNWLWGTNGPTDGDHIMAGWQGSNSSNAYTNGNQIATGGAHTHTYSGTTSNHSGHTHSGTAQSAGSHSHSVTVTVGNATATNKNTGGGQAHNNLPPYMDVNKIIKY